MSVDERWNMPAWLLALCALVLLIALFMRVYELDNLPGINGDEAYAPVHLMELFRGNQTALRTSTGTPFNPIHGGVVALVHGVADPSFLALRVPGLVYGLLSVALAFALLRLSLGPRVAWPATLLIASLPLDIAYARISQEPSIVPLASVVCVGLAFAKKKLLTAIALLLSIWAYPSCLFLLPLLAAPFVPEFIANLRRRALRPILADMAIFGSALAVNHLVVPQNARDSLGTIVQLAAARLFDPGQALEFAFLYGNLLSGVTIYQYISGIVSRPSMLLHVWLFWLIGAPVVLIGLWRMIQRRERESLLLLAGFGLSLLAFYAVTGLDHIRPHMERHAAFLAAPSCILFALCLDRALPGRRHPSLPTLAAVGLSFALLLSFQLGFFVPLTRAPQHAHRAYQAGPTDPKQLALEAIEAERDPDRHTLVLAEDWWAYWPIRYLVQGRDDIQVSIRSERWGFVYPMDFRVERSAPGEREIFAVVFAGGEWDAQMQQSGRGHLVREIRGYANHPVLLVVRLER